MLHDGVCCRAAKCPDYNLKLHGSCDMRGGENVILGCFAGAGSHAQNMTLEGLTRALGFILYGYCVFLFVFTAIMALSKPPHLTLSWDWPFAG